jgi:hypothetical protein
LKGNITKENSMSLREEEARNGGRKTLRARIKEQKRTGNFKERKRNERKTRRK